MKTLGQQFQQKLDNERALIDTLSSKITLDKSLDTLKKVQNPDVLKSKLPPTDKASAAAIDVLNRLQESVQAIVKLEVGN